MYLQLFKRCQTGNLLQIPVAQLAIHHTQQLVPAGKMSNTIISLVTTDYDLRFLLISIIFIDVRVQLCSCSELVCRRAVFFGKRVCFLCDVRAQHVLKNSGYERIISYMKFDDYHIRQCLNDSLHGLRPRRIW